MKRFAKPISAIAMLLVIVFCFSGCGIVDFTRSILRKDNTNVSANLTDTQEYGDTTGNNQNVTNSANVVPPSTQAQTHTPVTNNGGSTNATTPNTNQNTTAAPVTDSVTEPLTDEEMEELTVKELQDLLFATKDPNTAGKILTIAGFEYDEAQGIYYSQMNPLQRKFGFNRVYDMAAPLAGMIYSTKRIEFEYGGKDSDLEGSVRYYIWCGNRSL